MRTVMITKFVPLPADSGGKRRSLALLTRLAERGPTVVCAFADAAADLEGLAELGVEVPRCSVATLIRRKCSRRVENQER